MNDHPHQLGHIGGALMTLLAAMPAWMADVSELLKIVASFVAVLVGVLTIWSIIRDQRRKDRREVERRESEARFRFKEEGGDE